MRSSVRRTLTAGATAFAILASFGPSIRPVEAAIATTANALIYTESFAANPLTNGWEMAGDTNLFVWDAAASNVQVTWDSSKPNSYLRLPLGRAVSSEDDFSFVADFVLHDIAIGLRPEFPGAMQIAFGMQNRADADKPAFIRGTGAHSPNLVEFNYFPDSGFGATVWPAMIPTNGIMNYSGNSDFAIFTLPTGVPMRVAMDYSARNHTVTLTITTNGSVVGRVIRAPLVDVQRGFRLDAFSIASYSELGQNPEYPGSVLAHATIDNIEVRVLGGFAGRIISGEWHHQFSTTPGWQYQVEASDDLVGWSELGTAIIGTGAPVTVRTPYDAGVTRRFFRLKASR